MTKFRDIPIRQKLMAIIMAVTVVALFLSGLGVVVSDSILYRTSMQRDIAALAEIVADNSAAALAFDDPRAAAETLGSLKARGHLAAACIFTLDGDRFAGYLRPGTATCPQSQGPDGVQITTAGMLTRRPIELNQRRIGTLVLLYDLGEIAERLSVYGRTVLLVVLVTGLIALLLSSKLQEVIAGPIAQLAQATRSVSETRDYGVRAQKLS